MPLPRCRLIESDVSQARLLTGVVFREVETRRQYMSSRIRGVLVVYRRDSLLSCHP